MRRRRTLEEIRKDPEKFERELFEHLEKRLSAHSEQPKRPELKLIIGGKK